MRNLALAALLLATAASPALTQSVAPILTTPEAKDAWTYARPAEARVTHVDLALDVDFAKQTIGGVATLDVLAAKGAKEIVLDVLDLDITSITDAKGSELAYTVGAKDNELGSALTIQLGGAKKIRIAYSSKPGARALQWLKPEQTLGKKLPFLFSQGQAINNRSWVPTQDSPGIRQTWSATITVPDGFVAVMSAKMLDGAQGVLVPHQKRRFRFVMDKPVPPYLIAIAAGDLAFKAIGSRSGVWSEPGMLDAAVAEFGDVEKMIDAAQALYGPYRWGRYDMLVLPPSFPFGGMENPNLTFLTPTLLTGDRSNTDVVAHELAHSWSGNLVTNATWADSWLNEGFTNYIENRIMEAIYGQRRAAQEAALSFDDMMETLNDKGMTAPVTRLNLPKGEDGPDGGETGIVYDKGAIFLRTIEKIAGRDRFDAWLRSYFDRHAFQPMTSARFLADLRTNMIKGDKALEDKLLLDQWVFQPGLPANVARPDPAAFAAVDKAVAGFKRLSARPQQWGEWTTAERLRFLNSLPRKMGKGQLDELNRGLGLNEDQYNKEIQFAWLELVVNNRYDPGVPLLEKFLQSNGRGKFVRPLITSLAEDKQWGLPIARRVYAVSRSLYHPIVQRDLDALKITTSPPAS